MKKTITTLAMLASASSASALIAPPNGQEPQLKTICLDVVAVSKDESLIAGSCDQAANNEYLRKPINANGCADDQVAIKTYGDVVVSSCLPPGAVQL